jgi:hypothetical protein
MKLTQSLKVILVVLTIITVSSFAPKKKLSVEGAWTFVKVQTIRPDGTSATTIPKEGQAIFQKNHYSFCWTSHHSTSHIWQLTDAEKLDRFNQSIINTGTYELKDSVLTTKATFAMSPMFTNGIAKFKCSFSGDTLVLRGLSVYSADNVAHPVYANGSYIVSKLLPVSRK